MELISTHLGADFDAFASMLAARRLHPGARLFFPGSREESVRRAVAAGFVELEEVRQKEIEPARIRRLILCDTRQRDRIGILAEWIAAWPGIEVAAYDHHPDTPADLPVTGGIVDPGAGATSTLLAEELERRRIAVTPAEATLLLMGIYEDTGALTYPTTSPRDLQAAAGLLARGGDLAAVRRFALRRLDPERLSVLLRMTEALEVHAIHGHRVGVVALELGAFIDELAPLVSRCLEIFELPLLVALFGEEERVTVIARGEVPGFDLGTAMATFADGGGHATAAAGSLRGLTALEARERLLAHLETTLPPAARAADVLLRRFQTVAADQTIAAAKEAINRWRVNAAPVVDPAGTGRVVGGVTRQLLDGALQHGMAEREVARVMDTDLEWVAPEAPVEEIARGMLARHPRFVLVGDPATGVPEGIVTRMQVLRHLHGRLEAAAEPLERRSRETRARRQRAAELLDQGLPPAIARRVETASRVAREHRIPVYLVGGLVRDLLLGRENRDLDLVVEGDGPHFARLLAERLGGRVRVHDAFLTAVVVDPEGLHLDVATARSEFYRAPAALPEVQTSALRQDLYRRDFTINTLAIRLGPDGPPELIDYFGAQRDLKDRTLRVLHSLSFIDDPTRVLRAVRLELRLGFTISPETLRLVEVALEEGVFERLSGRRLRDELELLLAAPPLAEKAVERLDELGILPVLHPGLRLDEATRERLRGAVAALDWYLVEGREEPAVTPWMLALMAVAWSLGEAEEAELADRLALAGDERRQFVGFRERVDAAREALEGPRLAPHEAADRLAALSGSELLLLMGLAGEGGRRWIRRYLEELRSLELGIRGGDLVARGVPPGPAVGGALRRTLAARRDGRIGPEEELAFALEAARSGAGPGDAEEGGPLRETRG